VWVPLAPNPGAAVRLFCFPYAGGHATAFRSWPHLLPSCVDVYALQLPGRGFRIAEAPPERMADLVADVAQAILPHTDRPFAFFGHSLGALLGFEAVRWLRRHARPLPQHLFVSGRRAPQLPRDEPHVHGLDDEAFIARLHELNGTPAEILNDAELLELILPSLRADFKLSETYAYANEAPLACPITAFGGSADKESQSGRLDAWRHQTHQAFAAHLLRGNHFFIHTSERALLDILSHALARAFTFTPG
jgi:medium-chain acyl-[acyl-carrier-protein] hydrolase